MSDGWRHARTAPVVVMTVALLMTAGMPATAAHETVTVPGPNDGMVVHVDLTYSAYQARFGTPTDHLVGHHEWRRAVAVTYSVPGWNGTWAEVLDLKTGLRVADQAIDVHEDAPFTGLVPAEILARELDLTATHSGSIGPSYLLPESVLWGRSLHAGQSWTLHTHGGTWPDTAKVAIHAGENGALVANVSRTFSMPWYAHNGTDPVLRTVTTYWLLTLADGQPFATERLHGAGEEGPDGTWTWYSIISMPATVLDEGGPALPFEGHSNVAIVADRDQTLRYAPLADRPADPEPHGYFDVNEAAEAAWSLDDETVRTYRSKAVDPHLAYATFSHMYQGTGTVRWRITFAEAGGETLDVDLDGLKVPGLPLVVLQHEAQRAVEEWAYVPAATRAGVEVAYPGDYARLVDAMLAKRSWTPTGYTWSLDDHSGGSSVFLETRYQAPHIPLLEIDSRWVRADAATGVVRFTAALAMGVDALGDGGPL